MTGGERRWLRRGRLKPANKHGKLGSGREGGAAGGSPVKGRVPEWVPVRSITVHVWYSWRLEAPRKHPPGASSRPHFRFRPSGVTWRGRFSGHQHCGQTVLSYRSALRSYPGFAPARVDLDLIPILHGGQPRRLSDPSGVASRAGRDMGDRKWEP